MQSLVNILSTDQDFLRVLSGIRDGLREQLITGLSGSAQYLYLAGMRGSLARPMLIVTHNMGRAQQFYEDMIELLPESEVRLFPARETGFADVLAYSPELASSRLSVLESLARGENPVVIAPISALTQPLIGPQESSQSPVRLARSAVASDAHVLGSTLVSPPKTTPAVPSGFVATGRAS